ncbi:uncharacterized protein CDV56_107268 [Aspergillus thermomutatus]|uniref:Uncharacterized protein n=1 Tax=Aspergillus thermomutatus TaxID=41047 RepID=A0A397HEH7_ASPTH|nr:uncharacterized protein CDV56_107268 [Aspergillus thermomutatus]RHZ60006.1 hypothetical protein CDV56_107268 [Aspergillus thermomutatus]
MCLLNLPPELTLLISELLCPRDLNALARASRDFAYFFDPLLQDRALIDPKVTQSVLFWAAKNGREETIHKIHKHAQHRQIGINSVLKNRMLMIAARYAQVDLLGYLVHSLGADLSAMVPMYTTEDVPYSLGSAIYTKTTTALHAAALCQDDVVARRLIELGADVNAVDGDGASPLHYAAWNPTATPAVVRLLLEHSSKTETEDNWHGRPLHRAVGFGNIETIKLLLAYGADVAARGFSDKIPLHNAAERGLYESVVLLVEGGSDVNARTVTGWRPLDVAENNCFDLIVSDTTRYREEGRRGSKQRKRNRESLLM